MVERRHRRPDCRQWWLVKIKFCKSIPNGLKRVKNTKSATPNFCRSPVPATGGQPIFPLENVNTSYHSEFQKILSINVVGEHVFKKQCQNFTFQILPKIWLSFLTILTEKKNFCKSIPNGLKCVKNTKSATPNFCRSPVPATGGRPIFPLENVNTSYHTEFHQILTINVAWVPKRH